MPLVAPLVGLGTFALVMWVIALALALAVIMGYIAGVLHGLPFPLNQLAGPVESLAQGLSNAAGKLEAGVDHLIGASWHALARYMDHMWHHTVWSAHVLAETAESLARLFYAHAHLRALVHKAVGQAEAFIPRVKTLEREWHGIEHRVKSLERAIARGIGHDLRIHIRALEREVTAIRHGVIPGLRAGIKTAEGEVTDLRNFIRAVPGTRYLEWAAGIVASVLSLEILNLLRCPQGKNMANQRGCSMWGALDDLLGLVALGIVAADFEELVHEAQGLTDVATTVFDDVFGLSR